MFVSEEWIASSYVKTIPGIDAADCVFYDTFFWTLIVDIVIVIFLFVPITTLLFMKLCHKLLFIF